MCVVIKSRPEFKVGHVGSKTRSLGQFLEKPCVLSRRHSFDPVFMKLCQNDFLTLNKRLSRRAMLSDDSSCNSIALRKAKNVYNFGLSECNRVKRSSSKAFMQTPVASVGIPCPVAVTLHLQHCSSFHT